jgi:hypothetical protein
MSDSDLQQQVRLYNELVLRYEELDHEIDRLIMLHGGKSDRMSADDHTRYRQMARERDELQNEMRGLEQMLFNNE